MYGSKMSDSTFNASSSVQMPPSGTHTEWTADKCYQDTMDIPTVLPMAHLRPRVSNTAAITAGMAPPPVAPGLAPRRTSPLLISAYARMRKSVSEGCMAAKISGPSSHITHDIRRRIRHQQHHPYPSSPPPTSCGIEKGDRPILEAGRPCSKGPCESMKDQRHANHMYTYGSSLSILGATSTGLPASLSLGVRHDAGGARPSHEGIPRSPKRPASTERQHAEASHAEEGSSQMNETTHMQDDGAASTLSHPIQAAAHGGGDMCPSDHDRQGGAIDVRGTCTHTAAHLFAAASKFAAAKAARRVLSTGDVRWGGFSFTIPPRPAPAQAEMSASQSGQASGACTLPGLKPNHPNWQNQDSFFLLEVGQEASRREAGAEVPACPVKPASVASLYAVLDGHGEQGHLVSQFVRHHLPSHLRNTGYDVLEAFSIMQQELASCPSLKVACSGCTCVLVLARVTGEGEGEEGMRLTVANLGDSRCVLGRRRRSRPGTGPGRSDAGQGEESVLGVGAHLLGKPLDSPLPQHTPHSQPDGRRSGGSRRRACPHVRAVPLTQDHKPDRPDEFRRILAAGGQVGYRQYTSPHPSPGPSHHRHASDPKLLPPVTLGPARLWYQYRGDRNGLAMSRSFGDTAVHAVGGTSQPEVMEYLVKGGRSEGGKTCIGREEEEGGEGVMHEKGMEVEDEEDAFLILASDGLWDVVDNQEAVEIVDRYARASFRAGERREGGGKVGGWQPRKAAAALVSFARSRWEYLSPLSIDDITCVVVRLPSPRERR